MKKLLVSLLLFCSSVYATEVVRVIVPFSAGGPTAKLAVQWTDQLNSILQKDDIKLVPEYRTGNGGQIGIDLVARHPADELLLLVTSNQIITSYATTKPAWTMHRDLIPVAYAGTSPMILVTGRNSSIDTVKSMFEQNQTRPITMTHAGHLSGTWLAAIALQQTLGIKFNMIGYKGTAPAMVDVIGGHADMLIDFASTSLQNIQSGALKPVLVLSDTRLAELPTVPSYSELGYGTFPTPTWWGIYHNHTTNTKTLNKILRAVRNSQNDHEFKKTLDTMGFILKKIDMKKYVDEQIFYIKRLNISIDQS